MIRLLRHFFFSLFLFQERREDTMHEDFLCIMNGVERPPDSNSDRKDDYSNLGMRNACDCIEIYFGYQ
jgi:hypothetical protein